MHPAAEEHLSRLTANNSNSIALSEPISFSCLEVADRSRQRDITTAEQVTLCLLWRPEIG